MTNLKGGNLLRRVNTAAGKRENDSMSTRPGRERTRTYSEHEKKLTTAVVNEPEEEICLGHGGKASRTTTTTTYLYSANFGYTPQIRPRTLLQEVTEYTYDSLLTVENHTEPAVGIDRRREPMDVDSRYPRSTRFVRKADSGPNDGVEG